MTKHNWFREYCKKTTSHCMEYLIMKQRSLIEKLVSREFMIHYTIRIILYSKV